MNNVTRNTSASDVGDGAFDGLLAHVRASFDVNAKRPLFTTSTTGLFEVLLGALPEEQRQHYNCMACRRFVEKYGGLVVIEPDGSTEPAMWTVAEAPEQFRPIIKTLRERVQKAAVTGVFLSQEKVWGLPMNRDRKRGLRWTHLSIEEAPTFAGGVKGTEAAMAERTADFDLIRRTLDDYPVETFREAHKLLVSGNLSRAEAHAAMAKWFIGLHEAVKVKGREARHRQWLAVATAPPGYAHARNGVLGTLLDDVKAGLPFDDIRRKWWEKMDPLAYRRTQAPPTRGNIERAEKLVAALGITDSLKRRYAKLEEVTALWRPAPPAAPPDGERGSGSVFGHLRTKEDGPPQAAVEQPPTTMTWDKFRRTVLPDATHVEALMPNGRAGFAAIITGAVPDSRRILQWDNLFSHYLHAIREFGGRSVVGSTAETWSLQRGAWVEVTAVVLEPHLWTDETAYKHKGHGVFFLLAGARDTLIANGGGLFTEDLLSELHEVRSTLEAYIKEALIEGRDEATACGLLFQNGGPWGPTLRVTTKDGTMTYHLDRWD